MSDIDRSGLRQNYWKTVPMEKMNRQEWEALCDGCGKCCLNKLEDEDTGEVALTNVACRLLDDATCLCSQYDIRHQFVPECIVLTPKTILDNLYWLPQTCAYRLVHEKRPLYDWHPLISGNSETVHLAGVSMQYRTLSEFDIADEDWEEHIIEEPI
ncbi:MAG: YcgN family cysteine cluster protein [Marivivens sp.]|uniref:YcgN family cysteine cluster protein n=1 Tax=Marivivens sp. TaxID=1978374 RepID=UPI0017DEBB90|nr:YcgN family cysteine cluster protein [Marivivens sp.]NVJ94775.1 YcgN family cysteine cluster protein [Marivivens sp.]